MGKDIGAYMVVGSVTALAHGRSRATQGFDVVVEVDAASLERLVAVTLPASGLPHANRHPRRAPAFRRRLLGIVALVLFILGIDFGQAIYIGTASVVGIVGVVSLAIASSARGVTR